MASPPDIFRRYCLIPFLRRSAFSLSTSTFRIFSDEDLALPSAERPSPLFFASNTVKARRMQTHVARMSAPLQESITGAQNDVAGATESQSETQSHTARKFARNSTRRHLLAPARVGAATKEHAPNSAQSLSDEDRLTDEVSDQ